MAETNMPPDWMSSSMSFWKPNMNDPAYTIIRRPQHRTHAIGIGAVTKTRIVPVDAPRSTRAEELGLETSDLSSIKAAVKGLMEFVRDHRIDPSRFQPRDTTGLDFESPTKAYNQTVNITTTSQYSARLKKVAAFEEIAERLSKQHNISINQLQPKHYKDPLESDSDCQKLMKGGEAGKLWRHLLRMYSWAKGRAKYQVDQPTSEEPYRDDCSHTAIIAFEDAHLRNIFTGHGKLKQVMAETISKTFGRFLEDLLQYPQQATAGRSLATDRFLWYQEPVRFPGATDPSFSVSGVRWGTQEEFAAYIEDYGDCAAMKYLSAPDEDVLEHGTAFKPMFSHLLLPFKSDNKWRVSLAVSVPKWTILGLVPGHLHYMAKRDQLDPPSHWIELPNSVYFQRMRDSCKGGSFSM